MVGLVSVGSNAVPRYRFDAGNRIERVSSLSKQEDETTHLRMSLNKQRGRVHRVKVRRAAQRIDVESAVLESTD
jgi:hypothetical protein